MSWEAVTGDDEREVQDAFDDAAQMLAEAREENRPAQDEPAAKEEAGGDREPVESDPYEKDARAGGWVPKEEWVKAGRPEGAWRDAKAFVEYGQQIAPHVSARLRDVEATLAREREQTRQTIARMEEMNAKALERERARKLAEIEAEELDAVERGATDDYKAAKAKRTKLDEELPAQPEAAPTEQTGPRFSEAEQGEIETWKQSHAWFNRVPEATRLALRVAADLHAMDVPAGEQLKAAEEAVRRDFPHLFRGQRRERVEREQPTPSPAPTHATADPGSDSAAARVLNGGRRQKSARDLPADARTQAERFVKAGVFKSVDEYAAEYFE